jgi:hypothetical protein
LETAYFSHEKITARPRGRFIEHLAFLVGRIFIHGFVTRVNEGFMEDYIDRYRLDWILC